MSILNPCCCWQLRTGARLVAIIDLIVALILLIIFISDLTFNISQENGKRDAQPQPKSLKATPTTPTSITTHDEETSCEDDYDSPVTKIMSNISPVTSVNTPYVTSGVWVILTAFLVTTVGICAILFFGARNYSIRRCKLWFYIQSVITAVSLIVLILIICFEVSFVFIVLDLVHLIYRLYTLWVVYLYIAELVYLDTLCSLKKGGTGGTMYPSNMYNTNVTSPPPVYSNGFTYIHNPYQNQHPQNVESGNGISAIESPMHYNSSDDGFPANNGGKGGIDNPTYQH